jgi:hypothetical protein
MEQISGASYSFLPNLKVFEIIFKNTLSKRFPPWSVAQNSCHARHYSYNRLNDHTAPESIQDKIISNCLSSEPQLTLSKIIHRNYLNMKIDILGIPAQFFSFC